MQATTDGAHMFQVAIGHLTVVVQGTDRETALLAARKKLCEQMPRLWDLIQARRDDQFDVTQIN